MGSEPRRHCRGCMGRTRKKKMKGYCRDCMVDMGYIPTTNVYLENE